MLVLTRDCQTPCSGPARLAGVRNGQVCGKMESVGSPVQNIHKMTYGDKNVTFEPLPEMLHNARQAGLNQQFSL